MPNPTHAQLAEFGGITYHYASAEVGIKIAIAGILKLQLLDVLILTEPLTSVSLKNVAKSISKNHPLGDGLHDRFIHLVGEWSSFSALRNFIGHSRWTDGKRTDSIKPFGIDIRSGSVKYLGLGDDERDWTTEELQTANMQLRAINEKLVLFLADSGITAAMNHDEGVLTT